MAVNNGGYLSFGSTDERTESARVTIAAGVEVVKDIIATTLGPEGSDKLLLSSGPMKEIHITNDGATIMKHINLANPAAKIFAEMSQAQDNNAGDGTSSVVVLGAALYRACTNLINKKRLHPQVIVDGLDKALQIISGALDTFTVDFSKMDSKEVDSILLEMAKTSLSSKIVLNYKEFFAKIAVEAAQRIGPNSLNSIHILKKDGASMNESKIVEGFLLDKRIGMGQKKRIEKPKVLIANTQLDADKIKVFGASVKVDQVSKLESIETAEREKMMEKIDAIASHQPDVFINRQLIYDFPEQALRDRGIISIEHADFEGIERLAYVLNGEIASSFSKQIGTKSIQLGTCELIEERADILTGSSEPLVLFSGLPARGACTVVLRGATDQVLDEIERSLHDALCVVHKAIADQRYMLGGGCIDVLLSKHLSEKARADCSAIDSIIFEEIAQALLEIPSALAQNSGMDPATTVANLRQAAEQGSTVSGIDAVAKSIGDVSKLGVLESRVVKEALIKGAFEAVMVLTRIDGIVTNKPRQRNPDMRNH